jgi:hypothetical protein
MGRRENSALRAGIQFARKKQILIFMQTYTFGWISCWVRLPGESIKLPEEVHHIIMLAILARVFSHEA